jgi:hypothetical protein
VHRRKKTELLNVLWKKNSARRALRSVQIGTEEEENSLSSGLEGRIH